MKGSIKDEPVAYAAVARVGIALAGAFGLELTVEQVVTVITVVEIVIAWVTRRHVTPVRNGQPASTAPVP